MSFIKNFSTTLFELILNLNKEKIKDISFEENWNYDKKYTAYFDAPYYSIQFAEIMPNELYEFWFKCQTYEQLTEFLRLVSHSDYINKVGAIEINEPEWGQANGVIYYDFSPLFTGRSFENIVSFKIEQFNGHNHVPTISGSWDYEGGVCGKLLDVMPNLKHLVIPNSPSSNFFERDYHPLVTLNVQDFWFTDQQFIENLTVSTCFKDLEYLRFTEGAEDLPAGGENTDFEIYLGFFNNASLPKLSTLEIMNTTLSSDEVAQLKKTKLGSQLKKIQFSKYCEGDGYYRYFTQVNIETNQEIKNYLYDESDWRSRRYV